MKLTITFAADTQTLSAQLESEPEYHAVTPERIQQAVVDAGFGHVTVPPAAIKQVVTQAQSGKPAAIPLAVICDAQVQIDIAQDRLTAYVRVDAANGGSPLSSETLEAAIAKARIPLELVDRQVLMACLTGKEVARTALARARLPQDGDDAIYQPLVDSEHVAAPIIDATGHADMLNTHEFVIVDVGTPLMRRKPATNGAPGLDVTGQPIKPRQGIDPGFAKPLTGAAVDSQDSNLLVATVRGHPVVSKTGVMVDAVLRLAAVDVKTGNLDYDGSVEVAGDVAAGMRVKVSGDLIIKGSLERADVVVGNDLTVLGGIFGSLDAHHGDVQPEPDHAEHSERIQVGGNVQARFINLAVLDVKGNVSVREYIGNSQVRAGQQLQLGQQGGKGVLFGGFCEALWGAAVNQLGTESYLPTRLKLGEVDILSVQRSEKDRELNTRLREAGQLHDILQKIKQRGSPQTLGQVTLDKARKISNTIAAIERRVRQLQEDIAQFDKDIAVQVQARLTVRKTVFPGVVLNINGAQQTFTTQSGAGEWLALDHAVVSAT